MWRFDTIPYNGTSPAQDKKIDKCVNSTKWDSKVNNRTNKPYTKSEKIAICKSKVLNQSLVKVGKEWWLVEKKKKATSSALCQSVDVIKVTSEMVASVEDDEDGIFDMEMESRKLTYDQRKALPDSAFCLVHMKKGKSNKMIKIRRFPAHDKSHVKNGLDRLPQAELKTAERTTVRNCLVKRAKKFNIKVGSSNMPIDNHIYSFSPIQSMCEVDVESWGLSEEEKKLISSSVSIEPDGDGLYTVFAAMEGQKGFNMWGEEFTYAGEFFENNFKGFERTFYYPGHINKMNVEMRQAIVVKSFIKEIGEKKIVCMFHKIKPKNEAIEKEIQDGFLSDDSIDIFHAIFSQDDPKLIVDGTPYGTAFVAGLPSMKGCPVCKTVHTVGSSCILGCESPTDTPEVSGQKINDQEVENSMTDEKGEEGQPSGKEATGSPDVSGGSVVSKADFEELQKKQDEMESKMLEMEHGVTAEIIASSAGVEKDIVRSSIDSSKTPSERLAAVKAIAAGYDKKLKDAVVAKVTEDPKLAGAGGGGIGEEGEDGVGSFEQWESEMNGTDALPVEVEKDDIPIPPKKEGDN